MTSPSNKKRVVTDDDLQVLDAHIAYAKAQGDRAAGVVEEFDRATGEFAGVLADIEQFQAVTLALFGGISIIQETADSVELIAVTPRTITESVYPIVVDGVTYELPAVEIA